MSKAVKFGVVGCGRVSRKHLEALKNQLDTTELVAVCDVRIERAQEAGKRYDVPWYRDAAEMLEHHPDIEVVNILTPSGLHARNVIELAHYGTHFVVEKPMALTLDDADAMMHACAEHNTRLFVVKQNRYNKPIQKLREAVEAGRFGKMVMGTVRVRWCRDQAYYDQDEWRGTWSMDGGVLTNQASHHIDMLTWMMGDVESLYCYTATRLVNIETEDTAVAILRFTNGALGVVEATTATRPKDLEGSITIMGERGTVEVGGFAMNEIKVWNFVDATEEELKHLDQFKENPPNVYGFGHVRFLERVADAVRSGKGGVVDGLEGMKSLILINAMYESMETGREVTLKFRPHKARLGIAGVA
ncbi:MAG: gfo/Idh/MocA family oxidoreductase [Candidatus Dadabacteria bacterium]|nr:MAG: gfo/Idh/MocA family oxidoreductase [Candidatus Dadabacteria bacterium]